MAGRDELKRMPGPEKTAIMLLALGEDYGKRLWELFDDEEIREISSAMSSLGSVDAKMVEKLFIEFASQISRVGSLMGSYDNTERLLKKMLPKNGSSTIMEEIRGPAGRTMWDKLGNVNETVLASLSQERVPADRRGGAVQDPPRPCRPRARPACPKTSPWKSSCACCAWRRCRRTFSTRSRTRCASEFMSNLARTNRRDSHEIMADIFNSLDRAVGDAVHLTSLEERNRDSAERIKALMFTFEDLAKLDPSGIQTLLRVADKDKLGIALKGASDDAARHVLLQHVGTRGEDPARGHGSDGPGAAADVDEAQMELVRPAKDLAERGEIVLSDNKGDDELIY